MAGRRGEKMTSGGSIGEGRRDTAERGRRHRRRRGAAARGGGTVLGRGERQVRETEKKRTGTT